MIGMRRQWGLSTLGWLITITIFGFLILVASKLMPHYLDNRFAVSALQSLADNPEFPQMSVREVKTALKKRFGINNVRGKPAESVKVAKASGNVIVTLEYEERIHFLHNIDVVLKFHNLLDSSKPSDCCAPPRK